VLAEHSGRTAVVAGAASMTYARLGEESGRVAAALRSRGVQPGTRVGLHLGRHLDLITALVGVLRAGAAYVPLDPALPEQRLAFMAADCGARLILSDRPEAMPAPPGVDLCRMADLTGPAGISSVVPHPDEAAYVIYTSGSTGRPKGVEVTHRSLEQLFTALERRVYTTGPGTVVGWNASVSFDASVQQWLRLFRGDTVVLVEEPARTDPEAMAGLIARHALRELDISPSHLLLLLEHLESRRLPQPLRLLVGGEEIGETLWKRLAALGATGTVTAVNVYGPTECTVEVTAALVDGSGPPHLGTALDGAVLHVLDGDLRPADEGELYIGGAFLARGYRGRPGMTAERFVAGLEGGGGRMYRTGDLVRRTEGRLEYVGRSDSQIKLRGHRIEIGEVESVLERCPGVQRAVVRLEQDTGGDPALVAYCQGTGLSAKELRASAARSLPTYMVPSVVVPAFRLPLTVNGKIDHEALAALRAAQARAVPDPAGSPELSATEQVVGRIWCDVLGVPAVAPDDNFFDIGGQSALALRMAARLRSQLRRPVPMVAVFEHPTLRRLCAYLDGN
jgi:amino acid adenylation domain-containing protein